MSLFIKKPPAGSKGQPEVVPDKGFGLFVKKDKAEAASKGAPFKPRATEAEVIDVEPVSRTTSDAQQTEAAAPASGPQTFAHAAFSGGRASAKPAAKSVAAEKEKAEPKPAFSWFRKTKGVAGADTVTDAASKPKAQLLWPTVLGVAALSALWLFQQTQQSGQALNAQKSQLAQLEEERSSLATAAAKAAAKPAEAAKKEGLDLKAIAASVEQYWSPGTRVSVEATLTSQVYSLTRPYNATALTNYSASAGPLPQALFGSPLKPTAGCELSLPAIRGELNVIEAKIICAHSGTSGTSR